MLSLLACLFIRFNLQEVNSAASSPREIPTDLHFDTVEEVQPLFLIIIRLWP